MRSTTVAPLLSASVLCLALTACQTASNAPNGQLVTPATAVDTTVTPGSVPPSNDSLVNFVVPQTFKTFSGTSHYVQDALGGRETRYALDPVFGNPATPNTPTGFVRNNPAAPTFASLTYGRRGTLYDAEQPQGLSDKLQITRDPRGATFSIVVASGGVTQNLRWQDPQHRTLLPQAGIPGNSLYDSGLTLSGALPLTGNPVYDDYLQGINLPAKTTQAPSFGSPRPGPNASQLVADSGIPRGKTNIEYYESGSGTPTTYIANTLFFERVGQAGAVGDVGTNKYVTWVGYRTTNYSNTFSRSSTTLNTGDGNNFNDVEAVIESETESLTVDRSAFVYGLNSLAKDIPKTGTGTYKGSLFAHSTYTPTVGAQTQFDTIWGTATSKVNFANDSLSVALSGTFQDSGFAFSATGSAIIQRPTIPGTALGTAADQPISRFIGNISAVTIGTRNLTPNPNASLTDTFQASTIEGGFFGPSDKTTGQPPELGSAFRIVGGQPDQRLDILGTFVGARTGN